MRNTRIDRLYNRMKALKDTKSIVTVHFADGTKKAMRPCNVIDLLQENELCPPVIGIEGETGKANGQLVRLICGLL